MRIGQGYDVHRLLAGRALVLGGVEIPFDKGLEGHSDADVLVHAVCDALLGAAGLGDIGVLFPDSDPEYKGIYSIELLRRTYKRVCDQGYRLVNLDAVVIAQAPRLGPFREEMRKTIAAALACGTDRINIKATTTEGLGFTGSGEGIAAQCVALIDSISNEA